MIRINTVNPPGNELPVALYLDSAFRAAGIETNLFEPAPGRAALVARLRGNGTRRPVIIMGHMDVVGVEPSNWSLDPFGAESKDGYLYGRGAIDDKGMLAANLETMLLLKRHVLDEGGTLSRDVIFVANSDEEAGGEFGMGWLVEHHRELIDAEFALNEGGRTRIVQGKPLYVAVQNTEKVAHTITVTAHGPGGHASVPLDGNAIVRLGRALAAIGEHREPVQLTATTREFFAQLARVWPNAAEQSAMADVVSGEAERVARGARALGETPVFNAVLRTGISATIVNGGIRTNVIPTEVTALLNVRTLPGDSIDGVVARLVAVVNDPLVDVAVTDRGEDSPASDFSSALFLAIADSARELAPCDGDGAVHEHRCDGQRAAASSRNPGVRGVAFPDGSGGRGPNAWQRRADPAGVARFRDSTHSRRHPATGTLGGCCCEPTAASWRLRAASGCEHREAGHSEPRYARNDLALALVAAARTS